MKAITSFNEVKRTYFPKWRTASQWSFSQTYAISEEEYQKNPNFIGICLRKEKIILIPKGLESLGYADFRCLLAHELCHAVTSDSHGKRWCDRFSKVANRAEELGHGELATAIRDDIQAIKRWYELAEGEMKSISKD
jgi:hypothetical protein